MGDVIRSFEREVIAGKEFHKGLSDLFPRKFVGALQHPDNLYRDFAADETRLLGREALQQDTRRFSLLGMIPRQKADQDVRIDGDQTSLAPSAIARSISSSVTGGPSYWSTPNRRSTGPDLENADLVHPSITYLTRSPAFTDSASRTALGSVVWPFAVIPDSIMGSALHYFSSILHYLRGPSQGNALSLPYPATAP